MKSETSLLLKQYFYMFSTVHVSACVLSDRERLPERTIRLFILLFINSVFDKEGTCMSDTMKEER